MLNNYIFFVLLYATFIGFYNIFKKKSVERSNESVVLVIFSAVCFCLSLVWLPFGVQIPINSIWIFAVKGFLLSLSWFFIFKVMKDADVSLVSLTTVLSTVLAFIFGVVIFNETIGVIQIIGSILIITGAVLINFINKKERGKINVKHIIMLLASAGITAISNIIDKYTTARFESHQVQFWFLLFVFVFSVIFFIIECIRSKKFLIKKSDLKNGWIYLVALFLFIGDILLFTAYKLPGSKMIIISVLTKFKVVITVLLGIFVFKEKQIWKKILIMLLIVVGILLVTI